MTKDELFTLEDSLAQAVFVSVMNSRYVSVKQGNITFERNTSFLAFDFLRGEIWGRISSFSP